MMNLTDCFISIPLSTFGYFTSGIATVFFGLFGIFGILYSRKKLMRANSRISRYFLILSASDGILLMSACGLYGFAVLVTGKKLWYGPVVYFYLVFYPLVNMSMCGSIWLVLAISIERYLAVSQPLKHISRGRKGVYRICSVILLASFLLNLPTTFELTLNSCCDRKKNLTQTQITVSNIRHSNAYQFWYRTIAYMTFITVIPFFLVLLLTVKTLFAKRSALKVHRRICSNITDDKALANESQMAVLLTAVVVKFFICYTLPTVLNLIELIRKWANYERTDFFEHMVDASNILVVINSATNWCIFCRWKSTKQYRVKMYKRTLNDYQIERLQELWSCHDPTELGIELFVILLSNENFLTKFEQETDTRRKLVELIMYLKKLNFLGPEEWLKMSKFKSDNANDKDFLLKVAQHGEQIGKFLTKIIKDFDSENMESQISNLGQFHGQQQIYFNNFVWFNIKDFLTEKLLQNSLEVETDDKLVRIFASKIISKMKIAFISSPRTSTFNSTNTMGEELAPLDTNYIVFEND